MWKTVMESPRPGTRFVALYADGSGASLLCRGDDGYLLGVDGTRYTYAGGTDDAVSDWLLEADYTFWAELPEGFMLWGER